MKLFESNTASSLRPLIFFLNIFGFHLRDEKNKFYSLLHATLFLIALVMSGIFTFYFENSDYSDDKNIVVRMISYINCSCIFITLIIVSIKNVFECGRSNLWNIFKCFRNIDAATATLKTSTSNEQSRMFVFLILVVLFVISFAATTLMDVHDYKFNWWRCVYALLVYILGVKISLYCMLVHAIKTRFLSLSKYLNEENKRKSTDVEIETTTKLILTESLGVSKLEEICLIYDEVLQIISLLNESFSTLLSSSFSKYWTRNFISAC